MIVPDELLAQANALEATSFNLAMIAGPALAGTISAISGPDVVADRRGGPDHRRRLGLIARIPAIDAREPEPPTPGGRCARSCATGLRHLAATPALRSVTAAGAINLGGLGPADRRVSVLRHDELGADRSVSGYMWAAFAGGLDDRGAGARAAPDPLPARSASCSARSRCWAA